MDTGAGTNANLAQKWRSAGDAQTDFLKDFDTSNVSYSAAELGLTDTNRTVTLYIEGVQGSANRGSASISVRLFREGTTPSSSDAKDTARTSVGPTLLIIDGDNNNGTEQPDGNDAEKAASRPTLTSTNEYRSPGKIVIVNDDDVNNDGVPDYAAGFRRPDQDHIEVVAGVQGNTLTPLVVMLPKGADPINSTIRFIYDESRPNKVERNGSGKWDDPWVYHVTPNRDGPAGSLRLWTKDGTHTRDSVADFVLPADYNAKNDTFQFVESSDGSHSVTLYIESIRSSMRLADLSISVEIDPDGIGSLGFIYTDTVRLTAVDLTVALDDRVGYATYPGRHEFVDTTTSQRPFPFWLNNDFDRNDGPKEGDLDERLRDGNHEARQSRQEHRFQPGSRRLPLVSGDRIVARQTGNRIRYQSLIPT